MVEIFRKGFRLPIPSDQVTTFKKSQNLNGIQARYAYSNTLTVDKTADLLKLLDLPDLPSSKGQALQNGYTVDIVLNGTIQLRNQTLKITKETPTQVSLYLLYTDSAVVLSLKDTYINSVVEDFKYKKNYEAFSDGANADYNPLLPNVFIETQETSGLLVVEEMPQLINLQHLIVNIFKDNNYSVYGDFVSSTDTIKDYYVAPNKGVYQIYGGSGGGFSPTFDESLTAYDLLDSTLKLMNCYVEVDDTNRTVTINRWTNLANYKTDYADYSGYFAESQDFAFESQLAFKNKLTYSDSGTTFDSFFTNTLSSQNDAVYLDSAFGSGSLNTFDDAEVLESGYIPVLANGTEGEVSAVRILKVSSTLSVRRVYRNGAPQNAYARSAKAVSMRDIYSEFHKAYTEFILTPLIQNLIFRYDDILATDFSMTKVFFVKQQSSYWIPLEINFSTKKDEIKIKAMLVKQRKVPAPILNNFNSVLLNFRQKVIFPKEYLLSMYPMPPNEYAWQDVIFRSYDQTKNTLYINGITVPAASLPQVFAIADITSIVIESDDPAATQPNKLTDSLYIQAVDSNGGLSNEAYITLKHTGVASLGSDFLQKTDYLYTRNSFDKGGYVLNLTEYQAGSKPNLVGTVTSVVQVDYPDTAAPTSFNLVLAGETYTNVKVETQPHTIRLLTRNNGVGKARSSIKLQLVDGSSVITLAEYSVADNNDETFNVPSFSRNIPVLNAGSRIAVYYLIDFDNRRGSNSGSISVEVEIKGAGTQITTTKTI